MLRKETKEVVCKYCNKVFKTRKAKEAFCSDYCRYEGKKEYLRQKAKEYYKKLKKSKRQNQENILLIKKGNDYIYKYRKISQDTGLSYGVVKAWRNNATVLKQLAEYYSYVGKERYRVID